MIKKMMFILIILMMVNGVSAISVTLNTSLTDSDAYISFVGNCPKRSSATFDVNVNQSYAFGSRGGLIGHFIINSSGQISYDPSLDGKYITGLGTDTIHFLGVPIQINNSENFGSLGISFMPSANPKSIKNLDATPGNYTITSQGGVIGTFEITPNDIIKWNLDDYLIGKGTNVMTPILHEFMINNTATQYYNLAFVGNVQPGNTRVFNLSAGNYSSNNYDGDLGKLEVKTDGSLNPSLLSTAYGDVIFTPYSLTANLISYWSFNNEISENFLNVSSKSCKDLSWNVAIGIDDFVCGESDLGLGGCSGLKNYSDAVNFCESANARLCTDSEIEKNVVAETGCGYDNQRIWSGTSCGVNKHYTDEGKNLNAMNKSCNSDNELYYVRCCADVHSYNKTKDEWGINDAYLIGNQNLTDGKVSKSYYFNQNGYFNLGDNLDIFGPNQSFTYSAWIKPGALSINPIFSSGTSSDKGILIYLYNDHLYFVSKGNTFSENTLNLINNNGTWTHITITANRLGNLVFYLNGVFDFAIDISNRASEDWNNDDYVYKLGIDRGMNYKYLGNIDEVAIWNRALSDSEVYELYNNSKNGVKNYFGVNQIVCVDNDGDGWGAVGSTLSVCNHTGAYDCDDSDASIKPGVYDIPLNGIDEDCSGSDAIASYDVNVYFENETTMSGLGYFLGDYIGFSIDFKKNSVLSNQDVTNIVVNLTDVELNVLKSQTLVNLTNTGTGEWFGEFPTDDLSALQDDKINLRVYVYGNSGLLDWAPHGDEWFLSGSAPLIYQDGFSYHTNAITNTTVDDLKVSSSYGNIDWSGSRLDLRNRAINLSDALVAGDGFVVLKSSSWSELNEPARVTINNVDCSSYDRNQLIYSTGEYSVKDDILFNGATCPLDRCTNVICSGTNLSFDVTGFTGYAYGATANLTIYDNSENAPVAPNSEGLFYALYLNSTSGNPVTDGKCNITISTLGITNQPMEYNSGVWNYTANDVGSADFIWEVNCTSPTYTDLSTSDGYFIYSTGAVPEFSTWTIIVVLSLFGVFLYYRR